MAKPVEIVILEAFQIPQCADVIARAFFSDPFFQYTLPSEERRARILPWLFKKMLVYGHLYGQVYTTSTMQGLALWLGPKHTKLLLQGVLHSGMFLLPIKLSAFELKRNLELANLSDRIHKNSISAPHFYLLELAVDPSEQGKGLGTSLLKKGMSQADQYHLPCYLDTYNADNLSFYSSMGFSIVAQERCSPKAPPIWGMLRAY